VPTRIARKISSLLITLLKWLTLASLFLCLSFLLACYFFVTELNKELPDISLLDKIQYQTPLNIYSQDGLLIAQYGEKRSLPITIATAPKTLIKAFLAAEDDRFYQHSGVDLKSLLRAAYQLYTTGRKDQGGSTITMQVARNFLLSKEKTFLRKIKEILLALQIERRYSKDKILEFYLNKIYMGQRAYGVAAAAQAYYGKSLNELDLHQQAMIAGLPKAPSIYNPIANERRALVRRNYVLRRMLALHYINQAEFEQAYNQPDDSSSQPVRIELDAPFVAEMVRQELITKYGDEAYTLGLKVYTTVSSRLQVKSDLSLQYALHQYDERHGYRGSTQLQANKTPLIDAIGDCRLAIVSGVNNDGIVSRLTDGTIVAIPWRNLAWLRPDVRTRITDPIQPRLKINDTIWIRQLSDQTWGLTQIPAADGAFVALNPFNGAILALSGGFDFQHSKYNRATQSKRQPGSGFKPFIYTAALEKGFTPASIINDAPIVIEDPSQENDWRPENYSRKYLGPTSLRVALRESINLVSIRLLQEIGIPAAIETAMRFGFDKDQLPPAMSLALGSGYASPLRMASAYAVFANGGYLIKPYLIERIEDHAGSTVFQADPETVCKQCKIDTGSPSKQAPRVISEKIHFLMNSLLRDVVQQGTATQAKQLGRNDLAGKTGTTNDQRDAWFNGFTPDIVASAWIGFDNSQSLGKGETGGKTALPMWIEFMRTALEDIPETPLTTPEGITQAYINPADGLLLNPANTKSGTWEFFASETAPNAYSAPKPPELQQDEETTAEALF
jgi:penicillin-binding protein 1A